MSINFQNAETHENKTRLPLSLHQEGLWLLDQLEPGTTLNTLSATVHVHYALTSSILQTCLDLLALHHDLLRTTFHLHDGQLTQVIAPTLSLPLSVHDLRESSQAALQAQLLHLSTEQAQLPFSLNQGPLLRCTLILLPQEQSLLLLACHRILADDWSIALFVDELASLYQAHSNGLPSPLSLSPTPYATFAFAQHQALTPEILTDLLAYWQPLLADAPPALPLPFDYPRPAIAHLHGASVETILPSSLTVSLRTLSQQRSVSLQTTLSAAFATLLARYTGQPDLFIGIISPARSSSQAHTIFGPCDNTLVLRPDLSDDPSFVDLLTRLHSQLNDALAHEALPFESLVKAVQPTRSSNSTPIFQVLLRLPWPLPTLPTDWTLTHLQTGAGSSSFDLTLELQDLPGGLLSRITYRTDLFEPATIQRFLTHWQTLLESLVTSPSLSISNLPLLSKVERTLLLDTWTATQQPYPLEQSLSQLFEAQVQRTPEDIAVVYQGEQRTYQELNQQANRLAHHLRSLGVGPETLVALLTERSIPLLISILAVFKAGGAYLPLDPHHPENRLRNVIEQSHCSLVLSTIALAPLLSQAVQGLPAEARPVCLTFEEGLSSQSLLSKHEENLPESGTPHSLAYVIYTSGSTGRPKGAMVERRGMINHLFAKIDALHLSAGDTVAQTASQCFDISVWQFLAPLLVGGYVQILPDSIAHDPTLLLQQVEQQQINILEIVPSLLRAMLDAFQYNPDEQPKLAALRWLIPTGEALPPDLCRRWLQTYPHVPLLNAYGPTECSDDVTHFIIQEPPAEDCTNISIGSAIPNMRIYVLDPQLQPLPIGVSGELYVGGVGVGRGYLGDEQRTQDAFVPDPFTTDPHTRLYKTGDRARYLPDGTLEFLGRLDFQVKLRGFRIELGEIEAVLHQHPAVRQALALVREDIPGDKRLVAYIELQTQQSTTTEELKRLLQQQVPTYMVPAAFVLLQQFPLTSNGKLDRAALPAPDGSHREESYVAPILPIQQQLVAIWEELLGMHPIGIQDDFFEMGGDSLLAVRLFNRIEQVIGQKLALSTLFAGATIEQLAQSLAPDAQAVPQTETRTPVVAVQTGGSKPPFFYLHGEWRGGALYSLELARTLGPEQPFYQLEPYRFEGLTVPPTFEEMAAAHLETLRSIQPEGPYLLGGYCNGALIAYEMAQQLRAQGQSVDLLLLIDPDAPARHRWFRRTISNICTFLSISEQQQFACFLSLQHLYRYARFSHYRQTKIAELSGVTQQAEHTTSKGASAPLRLKLKALFPKVATLRQAYLNFYDWSAFDYAPDLYPDKITFFWTSEEPWRPVGWQQIVKEKEGNVEIQTLPGNHITSRTEYLPVLAEHFRACVTKAQQ